MRWQRGDAAVATTNHSLLATSLEVGALAAENIDLVPGKVSEQLQKLATSLEVGALAAGSKRLCLGGYARWQLA